MHLRDRTTSFSTSGTYTKTTQLIPIKIKLVNSDIPLENIIGTNATVNIKVKGKKKHRDNLENNYQLCFSMEKI